MPGKRLRIAAMLGPLAAACGLAAPLPSGAHPSDTAGKSTLEQTITGDDPSRGFSFLRLGPGEPHVVRQELAAAPSGRESRRRSIVYLAQLTDFQVVDEESPARVEFFDADPSGFASSAWRPHEAFVVHSVDWTIRQVNRFLRSPVAQGDGRRARLLNAVLTGDLADNMQRNETEWVVRLLEGGALDPNSGTNDLAGTACPPGTPLDDPRNYTGVQDYDDYLLDSPLFWDPERPIGQFAGWPVYPNLMDRAQAPFEVEGLKVPSYVAFGNHDALVQGNEDAIRPYEDVATGCVKPLAAADPANPFTALDPAYLQGLLTSDPSNTMLVPPDEKRQFVDQPQFKELHSTGRQGDAHGFAFVDEEELAASNGDASYYSFSPRRGVRYIVLDTLSDGGVVDESSNGNIDHPQFLWLERELAAASARDELILVFGHHAKTSLTANVPDELAPPCTVPDEHGHDVNPGCDRDPRSSTPLHLGDDLEELLHRFPHAVAYIAGHSHENRVQPLTREGGGYWEIKSPAVIDWPPQHRLVEVMDNCDGTLSIFGTLLDHAAPTAAPGPGSDASSFDAETLAALGRTITWNDPQQRRADASGQPTDRNVELLIRDPRRARSAIRKLRVTVSPRRAVAGRRTRFRFRVTGVADGGSRGPVEGATVRFAGRSAKTNRRGRAAITARLRSSGRRVARAAKAAPCGRARDRTAVRVRTRAAARRRSAIGLTG